MMPAARWIRSCCAAAVILLAAGCSDPLGPESERTTLSLRYEATGPLATPEALRVELAARSWSRTVPGSSLEQLTAGVWTSQPLPIASPGRLAVHVRLLAGDDTVATGNVAFDVQRRYRYDLWVWVGRGDPRKYPWVICVPSVHALPVRAPAAVGADSVYLLWAGLPRDAIC